MPDEYVDQMDAAAEVLAVLAEDFDSADLPGNGDLADAVARAGYRLAKDD